MFVCAPWWLATAARCWPSPQLRTACWTPCCFDNCLVKTATLLNPNQVNAIFMHLHSPLSLCRCAPVSDFAQWPAATAASCRPSPQLHTACWTLSCLVLRACRAPGQRQQMQCAPGGLLSSIASLTCLCALMVSLLLFCLLGSCSTACWTLSCLVLRALKAPGQTQQTQCALGGRERQMFVLSIKCHSCDLLLGNFMSFFYEFYEF